MFTIEITLKSNPLALSVQRQDAETAEVTYQELVALIGQPVCQVVQLTCDKVEGKKVAIASTEITAVQILEKGGTAASMGAGFLRG
ncbi:MAG: hypothetical protein HC919_06845 [Oscillatoriales cyanobacterium SM2_2_1]|nr:hypothetical protein [Oscillatoriales cyanobacterium SM2_2_1]